MKDHSLLQLAVISLARTPCRWDAFKKRLGNQPWPLERVWGVDAELISDNDLNHLLTRRRLSASALAWPKGQVGCALSHQLCWRKCIASGMPMLVFEDDALLAKNWHVHLEQSFNELPIEDWDLLLLGWNQDSCLQVEWAKGLSASYFFHPRYPSQQHLQVALNEPSIARGWSRVIRSFGLAGYVVSVNGAKRLLSWSVPLRTLEITNPVMRPGTCFSLDGQLNGLYPEINAWVLSPPLIVGANEKMSSLTT